jgi:hypothetical protein
MLTTPPVKNVVADCVQQYKNVNSVLDTPIFPTPTPALTPTVNPYAPSAEDGNKMQITIDTLERLSRAQSNIAEKDSIQKLINQLRSDLMYFKIKNNG